MMMQTIGVEQREQQQSTPPKKQDARGKHWAEKVKEGNAPTPWKAGQDWAKKRREMESSFSDWMKEKNIRYILPWNMPQHPCHSLPHLGNTKKVLFMHLKRLELEGKLTLTMSQVPYDVNSFCGITAINLTGEQLKEFDAGMFPSPRCERAADMPTKTKATMARIWHTAGFQQSTIQEDGSTRIYFHEHTFKTVKAQMSRHRARQGGRSASPPTPPAATTTDGAMTMVMRPVRLLSGETILYPVTADGTAPKTKRQKKVVQASEDEAERIACQALVELDQVQQQKKGDN